MRFLSNPPEHMNSNSQPRSFGGKLLETLKRVSYDDFQKKLAQEESPGWKKLLMARHPCYSYAYVNTKAKEIEDKSIFVDYVLDCFHYPLYMIDINYNLLYANKAALEVWGVDEIPEGARCYELTHKSSVPCNEEHHPCTLRAVKRTGGLVVHEHIHHGKDGNPLFIKVHGHPVYGNNRELAAIIEFSENVTQQKLEQLERKKMNAMLAGLALRASEGTVAGGVRHDFANALFSVLGMGALNVPLIKTLQGMLKDENCDRGEFARLLAKLSTQMEIQNMGAKMCETRLNRLKIFSPNAAKIKATEISEAVENSIVLLEGLLADARSSGKRFGIHVQGGGLPITARINPGDFNAVFSNIVKNAVEEFGDDRTYRIDIGWGIETSPGNDVLKLRISNDGPQIPEYLLRKMFKEQVASSKQGQGLGLAQAATLIREHGGSIACSSTAERTTFEITLMLTELEGSKENVNAPVMEKGARIAILDDEALVNLTIEAMLPDQECTIYEDPQKALMELTLGRFDAVILDVSMPGAYGPEFAKKIRKSRPETAIVVLTGHALPHVNGDFLDIIDVSLEKPISEQALRSALAEAISKRKGKGARDVI